MHVLIVTDQHPESLGGVQVAIRLQRRYLERLGHRVTIAAPALHRSGYEPSPADAESRIDLPSIPITRDREYGLSLPGARTDRALAAALRALPPVDLVHVQGDFWGALIGLRAARGLRVPTVITMHNNVDEGTRAVTPLAPLAFQALRVWRRLALGRAGARREPGRAGTARGAISRRARGAWRYLAELAAEAAVVTAPSRHFADALERNGVADEVLVTRGGVDDGAISATRAMPRTPRSRPRLVWLGRMSHEKRVLEFIDAVAASGIDADVVLHGGGLLLAKVRQRIDRHGLADRVTIAGPVPYEQALASIHDADALVQTSIGFETQGLTPFEAAALGTPTVFCDHRIADDLAASVEWRVADGSVGALASALRDAVADLSAALRSGSDGEPRTSGDGADAAPGAAGSALHIPEAEGRAFLQSTQAEIMLGVYERALRTRGAGEPADA